jgi:ribonuclease P/MRP protein subunit RPP1
LLVVQSYDLLAVQVMDEKLMQQACGSMDIDIITFNLAERLPFQLRFATLGLAIARGIMFEIAYAPLIDGMCRQNATRSSCASTTSP